MWDLLSPQDFVTSCIGHLENNGSLSYVNMPNVDVFVYDIKKITFVNISIDLIKIVLTLENLPWPMAMDIDFPKL